MQVWHLQACLCGGGGRHIDGKAIRRPPLLCQLLCARIYEPQRLPRDLHDLVGRRVAAVQALQRKQGSMSRCEFLQSVRHLGLIVHERTENCGMEDAETQAHETCNMARSGTFRQLHGCTCASASNPDSSASSSSSSGVMASTRVSPTNVSTR